MEVGTYYINKGLKERWDKIKDGKLAQMDEDRVYIVDGREGIGKSLFAIQQAAYIDPTIIENEGKKILPRITFSPEETLHAIRNTKSTKTHTKVIVFDEAFRGLSSKSALSKVNKSIIQAMMEMRQNNLVLFIVSPSFFLLELYPAILRSNTLFHIYKTKKYKRRFWRAYNFKKKARIYQIGVRKGWGYPIMTGIKDGFYNKYPGGKEFEEIYRRKKYDSLTRAYADDDLRSMGQKGKKYLAERNILLVKIKNSIYPDKSCSEFSEILLKELAISLSDDMLEDILRENSVSTKKEKEEYERIRKLVSWRI